MIKCIAIDDDIPALETLKGHIAKVPFLVLQESFGNAFEALEYLDNADIDLVFLEVEMTHLNGLEFLSSLRRKPQIVVVSRNEQYAFEAFNQDVTDYILKPITFSRFLRAVNKVRENIHITSLQPLQTKGEPESRKFIFIKSDYKTIRIDTHDILFVEGLKDYVKVHTVDKPILSLLSLRNLEQGLSSDYFFRVHRSYIVALGKIDVIERNRIKIGTHSIPVSDMYREAFIKKIQPFK